MKDIYNDTIPDPPKNPTGIRQTRSFLSAELHPNMTPAELIEQWAISVAQTALTMKATTQKLVQLAIMLLSRNY